MCFIYKKNYKELLYPLLYIFIAILAYFLEDFIVLKLLPALISFIITALLLISYINKKSLILYFAQKFSKKEISKEEKVYIHKSTAFWIVISLINLATHIYIFKSDNINFWIYYSSVGWYTLFLIGGVIQFLHRKFIFLKDINV